MHKIIENSFSLQNDCKECVVHFCGFFYRMTVKDLKSTEPDVDKTGDYASTAFDCAFVHC